MPPGARPRQPRPARRRTAAPVSPATDPAARRSPFVAADGTASAEHAGMSILSHEASSAPRAGRALCLSGGGYRAALFHLGALLRLHATGRLHGVDVVSSVSGGSIASAWLAARYALGRNDPREPF